MFKKKKSIYDRLKEDFAFLNDYGFIFDHETKHHETPSVFFKKNMIELQIGYSYNEDRIPEGFYLYRYGTDNLFYEYCDLLDEMTIIGKSYKDQVDQVKEFIIKNHNRLLNVSGVSYENKINQIKEWMSERKRELDK